MQREVIKIEPNALPSQLEACFALLTIAGAEYFALFGGAVRDADYAAAYGLAPIIKDYDVRVWLPANNYAARSRNFIAALGCAAQTEVQTIPSPGNRFMRQCVSFADAEIDMSIRPASREPYDIHSVATNRAGDADIGICSVAVDPSGHTWATPEYVADRDNRTLSVYPSSNAERMRAYTSRMQQKFPSHTVIYL